MAWDPNLASSAQAWADGCIFEHSDYVSAGYSQNLSELGWVCTNPTIF